VTIGTPAGSMSIIADASPPQEPARDARSLQTALLACAAAALVLLAIVVPFLRYHGYNLLLPESLILLGGAIAVGTILGLASQLRPMTLGPAVMAILLCVFIFQRAEVSDRLLPLANAITQMIGNLGTAFGLIITAAFLAAVIACWLLKRHLNTILATIFGTIVLSSLVLPPAAGGEPIETGALPQELSDLPPLLHIVLDEHIGLAGLPPELPESTAAAEAILTTYKDFDLYPYAYSRFAETRYSLASLMNGDWDADVGQLLDRDWSSFALHENAWFERLKAQGYAIRLYQTDFLDMCGAAADACYTYSLHSLNPIQLSTLSTGERLHLLLSEMNFFSTAPLPAPLGATDTLQRVEADIASQPRGVATIVHLLLPHEGFLYRENCSVTDPSGWEGGERLAGLTSAERSAMYRLYLSQVVCTERQIARLFATLKEAGIYDDATIIVHGDHGSRIGERPWISDTPAALSDRDLVDHFSTLLAIKAPGGTGMVRERPVAVQQLFAEEFLHRAPNAATTAEVMVRSSDGAFGSRTMAWPGTAASEDRIASQIGLRRLDESLEN
jgi:hypothetical protein